MENDIKYQTDQINSYEKAYVEELNSKRSPLLQERLALDEARSRI